MLRRTALHPLHVELGAKLVDFAGWEMPVQFAGVLPEHLHTRSAASLFDVSHMGQLLVRAEDPDQAAVLLETVMPASLTGLNQGRQRYVVITTAAGGVLDDLMVARRDDHFLLVANAARTAADLEVLRAVEGLEVTLVSDRALLALQGPAAETALVRLVPDVRQLVFMDAVVLDFDGHPLWVSRSGYTGEDGFEVSVPDAAAVDLARALLAMDEVAPAGLGARDSLRLEAGMPLYGHELDTGITPAQAGIGWAVPKVRRHGGSREGGFPGADVILPELQSGPVRIRRGLRPAGRAPVREGVELFADEHSPTPIASVTSGGYGPSVGGPIAMGMLPAELSVGDTVFAELRGKRVPVSVHELPFIEVSYKR